MYTYYFDHTKPFYNRHENRLFNADGTQAPSMLITRYTSGYKWQTRGVKGPRGGKARKERKFNIFYRAGMFYRSKNVAFEDGRKLNSYEPFEGIVTDAYPVASRKQGVTVASLEIIEGVPVSAKDSDGAEVWAWGMQTIAELEDMLQIPEQDRAETEPTTTADETAEQPEQSEIVAAAAEIVEAEAARVAWIESTTTAGQQIDLFAYAGYAGDTAWQELAYAGGK